MNTSNSTPRYLLMLVMILSNFWIAKTSHASHPRIPSGEFKGAIVAITPKSITVKSRTGTRVFAIMTGKYDFEAGPGYAGLGEKGVTRTQINCSIAIDLNPADVFKVGDPVTVDYWPTLNDGKEAGNISYSDLDRLRAWNRENKAHIKSE